MVASIIVMLLSAITAVAMCRVFADWVFLRTLLVMVVGVHAVSIMLRIAKVPGVLAIPLVMVVIVELMALLFYRDTMRFIFPSGDTLRLLRLDLRLVWSQFPTAVAPVPSEGSFLLAAALGLGLVSMFADAFAFRAFGRAEAVVPAGVLFIFTAALGTDRNRIGVARAWFAAALVVVAVLRALHGGGAESWLGRRRRAVGAALPATAMCALVAALGARRRRTVAARCRRGPTARDAPDAERCHRGAQPAGRHPVEARQPAEHRDVHRQLVGRPLLAGRRGCPSSTAARGGCPIDGSSRPTVR